MKIVIIIEVRKYRLQDYLQKFGYLRPQQLVANGGAHSEYHNVFEQAIRLS